MTLGCIERRIRIIQLSHNAVGSSSDHRHFVNYAGVSAIDFRYRQFPSPTPPYPLYHTIHETMNLIRLIDSKLVYHQAVARLWGEMGRRLADSTVIPFNVSDYGRAMTQYVDGLEKYVKRSPAGKYADINYVQKGGKAFVEATVAFDAKILALLSGNHHATEIRIINDQLMQLERMFIVPSGIPRRAHLRHVIFAPPNENTNTAIAFAGITNTLDDIEEAQQKSGESDDVLKQLIVTLNDQISWAAQCLYSATDLLTREI